MRSGSAVKLGLQCETEFSTFLLFQAVSTSPVELLLRVLKFEINAAGETVNKEQIFVCQLGTETGSGVD